MGRENKIKERAGLGGEEDEEDIRKQRKHRVKRGERK
jgi:hypothetical protein